jgi:glycosyltransferase involved in cell wall biosynthesis
MSKKNNILIISPLFNPEMNRVNDIVNYLLEKNNNITVLCPIPNYPKGRYFKNYGIFKKRYEKFDNLKIFRILVYPRKDGSKLNLFLNYFSFIVFSIIPAIILSFKKFDLIFINQLSPITIALPGIIVKKIKRIPLIMWVTDLWPESVKDGGNLKSDFFPIMLNPLVKYIYKNCNEILVSSRSFIDSVAEKTNNKMISYMPQWSEDLFTNVKNVNFSHGPMERINGFKLLFAGNIGVAQDFDTIICAMKEVKNFDIHLVVLGEGRAKKGVLKKIKKHNLENSISMLGSFPLETMPYFFSKSDALLISLKKSNIFSKTIPSKTQPYMSSGKPILTNADGEVSKIINEAQCGLTSNSGDFKTLSQNIIRLSKLSSLELELMGTKGKKYSDQNFDRKKILSGLNNLFNRYIENDRVSK